MTSRLPTLALLYEAIDSVANNGWNPVQIRERFSSELAELVLTTTDKKEALDKFLTHFHDQFPAAQQLQVNWIFNSDATRSALLGPEGILGISTDESCKDGAAQVIQNYLRGRSIVCLELILDKVIVSDNKIPQYVIHPLGEHLKIAIKNTSEGANYGTPWRIDPNTKINVAFEFVNRSSSTHCIENNTLKALVEANKARLFCLHWLGAERTSKSVWFLQPAVDAALNEFNALYSGSSVGTRLGEFFGKFTAHTALADFHLANRGVLLYGPPGTGKTTIIKRMADVIGLTLVYPPFAAGAINEPLVGDAEKNIMKMFQRAREIPWLPCALVIDEIDSIAPTRSGDTADHKVSLLSILLAEFGGIKHVPNMFVFGSTNRLGQMDEAFKRRMHLQLHVGVMTYQSRNYFLDSVLLLNNVSKFNWQANNVGLSDEMIKGIHTEKPLLLLYTQNFTIDLLTKFMDVLLFMAKGNSTNQDYNALINLAFQRFISYYPLEGFSQMAKFAMKRHMAEEYLAQIETQVSKINKPKTGRMVVHPSLTSKVEIMCEEQVGQQLVYDAAKFIKPFEYSALIRAVLEAASVTIETLKFDYIQHINLLGMVSAGIFDEKDVAGKIQGLIDEAHTHYSRSITIIDVDQLVMVTDTSGSVDSMTPPSVMRMQVLETIVARFNLISKTDNQREFGTSYPAHWIILIIDNPIIWQQMKRGISWFDTAYDIQKRDSDTKHIILKQCHNCGENYTEEENKPLSCIWHTGQYINDGKPLGSFAARFSFDDPNDEEGAPNSKPEDATKTTAKSKARWDCCRRVGKDSQGCFKSKHMPTSDANSRLQMAINNKKITIN